MHALVFERFGGPEVLQWREVPDPIPEPMQVLVRTKAIGLNFSDIYRRQGNYHLKGDPPWIAGYEAAGEVVSAPPDCGLKPGDRVAFADSPHANAELVVVDLDRIIRLPDAIDFETAAAVLLQGLTADYLIHDSHPLIAGETILVHAAAGGVGQLLVQMANAKGAQVIGLVSSESKRQIALASGAATVLLTGSDWLSELQSLYPRGVDVVFDSTGSTLDASLDAVRIGGRVVFYGMAGGDPAPVEPRVLMDGSKTLTGGDLWNVLTSAAERQARASKLFNLISNGALKVQIDSRYPLADGAGAHARLQSRLAMGKILLIP
jgi:NADPH2:quinone reductase